MTLLNEIITDVRAFSPNNKDYSKLGITFFIILGSIGLVLLWQRNQMGYYFCGAGVLLVLWAIIWPKGFAPVYYSWMGLAIVLGAFVSRILLAILFYFIVTPIGLIARLFKKDFLNLKQNKSESYWHIRYHDEYNSEDSEKMY